MRNKWALRDLNPGTSDYESGAADSGRDAGQGLSPLPPVAPSEAVAQDAVNCVAMRTPPATNSATSSEVWRSSRSASEFPSEPRLDQRCPDCGRGGSQFGAWVEADDPPAHPAPYVPSGDPGPARLPGDRHGGGR